MDSTQNQFIVFPDSRGINMIYLTLSGDVVRQPVLGWVWKPSERSIDDDSHWADPILADSPGSEELWVLELPEGAQPRYIQPFVGSYDTLDAAVNGLRLDQQERLERLQQRELKRINGSRFLPKSGL